jgi:hypothetical protein
MLKKNLINFFSTKPGKAMRGEIIFHLTLMPFNTSTGFSNCSCQKGCDERQNVRRAPRG